MEKKLDKEQLEMSKQQVLSMLSHSKSELQARFGVVSLALFDSIAKDTTTGSNYIGVLVAFDGPANSQNYFGTQFYIENLLGCSVDLITKKALVRSKSKLRSYIEQSLIDV